MNHNLLIFRYLFDPATSLDGGDHHRLTMFIASEHTRPGKVNVLLISSGSVASIKIPLIVEALLQVRSFQTLNKRLAITNELTSNFTILSKDPRIDVQVVATKTSLTFYTPEEVLKASQGRVRVWTDDDEWGVSRCVPRTHN